MCTKQNRQRSERIINNKFCQHLPQINKAFLTKHNNKKQEAHGPHRSPEKTVQINKHMIIS